MVGPSWRLWRALFAMCVALAAFAVTGRADAATSDTDAVDAMSYRIAPVSAVPAPPKAPEMPSQAFEGIAFRCDARGAITIAPAVRLEFGRASVTSAATDECVSRCEGGAWERPLERPATPPASDNFAATFGALPSIVAPSWVPAVPAEAVGLGDGANAARGLERPPRPSV